jgi:hypothetical protein
MQERVISAFTEHEQIAAGGQSCAITQNKNISSRHARLITLRNFLNCVNWRQALAAPCIKDLHLFPFCSWLHLFRPTRQNRRISKDLLTFINHKPSCLKNVQEAEVLNPAGHPRKKTSLSTRYLKERSPRRRK